MAVRKKPKPIWMVQYNLAGLQKPIKLTYHDDPAGWWDRSGNFGEDSDDAIKPANINTRDRVVRYFSDEDTAQVYYDCLDRYRTFIRQHL